MTTDLKVGFDIDGVLVNDVDASEFNDQQLKAMLAQRKYNVPIFQPEALLSVFPGAQLFYITARPIQDLGDTTSWLRDAQIRGPVYSHTKTSILSSHGAAELKARHCINLGLNIFIESSIHQAGLIKTMCPNVLVICFGPFVEAALRNGIHEALKRKG